MKFQGDYSGGGGSATTRANQKRDTTYTYGLFESDDPKIETSASSTGGTRSHAHDSG